MKDQDFKTLPHRVGSLSIDTRGAQIADGYKPDVTVSDGEGCLKIIIENEQKTDRKAYLGDLIKAAEHADRTLSRPLLLIVMSEFSNTTVEQIALHLERYAHWLNSQLARGIALSGIVVMADDEYVESNRIGEIIGEPAFLARGRSISFSTQQSNEPDA